MEMQLFLMYKGKGFTWNDVDNMPIYELVWFYDKLVEWKKEEQEAINGEQENPHEPAAMFSDPFE